MNDRASRAGLPLSAPELREDIVSGRSVLMSAARAQKPRTVTRPASTAVERGGSEHDPSCSFCVGNEHHTRPEIFRSGGGAAGEPGWRIRVFPNLYPVVDDDGLNGATGASEIIVWSPAHDRGLDAFDDGEIAEVLSVIRDRVRAHVEAGRTSVQVFVNDGGGAGASIAHPHAQIIGLDFLPPGVREELSMVERAGEDPVTRDLEQAAAHGLVIVDAEVAAWSPWAASLPYLVRIAPCVPDVTFVDADDATMLQLAHTLGSVLRAIVEELDSPPLNVVLFADQQLHSQTRRWRFEVVPRLAVSGGFELGAMVGTHAADPVMVARALRARIASADRPSAE